MIELPVVKASLNTIKPKPSLRPDHDLLGEARQMHAGECRRGEELDRKIAVRNSVERVGRGAVEAERRGGRVAIDRKRGAGERRCTERRLVEPAPAIGEAAAVAADHLDIGHQMMAEGHRLGDLQMSIAGHHRGGFRLGPVDQRLLQLAHCPIEALDRAAHPQPQIGRDLIVARTRGVQAPRRRPDQLGEARLDVHVNVLVLGAEAEAAAFDFRSDLV